jgi:hypothetical protein
VGKSKKGAAGILDPVMVGLDLRFGFSCVGDGRAKIYLSPYRQKLMYLIPLNSAYIYSLAKPWFISGCKLNALSLRASEA